MQRAFDKAVRRKPRGRRTRVLCKLNGVEGTAPCHRRGQLGPGIWQKNNKAVDGRWGKREKRKLVVRQGTGVRGVAKHASFWCCGQWFHATSVTWCGGERSWIWAAVSLSMTTMGPPQLGQSQRGLGRSVEARVADGLASVCGGAEPRVCKQSGSRVARRRLARKPKWRMRTKPLGSTCNRKRRRNSSSARVSNFCWLL